MASQSSNISSDLVWTITRTQNAYLVKRNSAGGCQFSRDPLNVVNKHSFKYAGYVNDKAIGVQPTEDGGVAVITKNPGKTNQPTKSIVSVTYGPNANSRKIYKNVADMTAKNGYRADVREEAIARVSAVRRSQRPKTEEPPKKLRGAAAKRAAEKKSE